VKHFTRKTVVLLILTAAAFVLCCFYFGMKQADENNTVLQDSGWYDVTDSFIIAPMYLEKGEYTVSVGYHLAEGEGTVRIVSTMHADSENQTPLVLAEQTLVHGENAAELTFTLDKALYDVSIQYDFAGSLQSGRITVRSSGRVYTDSLFLVLLMALLLIAGLWIHTRASRLPMLSEAEDSLHPGLAYLVLVASALVATLPMIRDFLIYGQDALYHMVRIEGIKDGLLQGQFPVLMDPTFANTYGYTIPAMYPSLFLYLPAVFRLCGVSPLTTYQTFIFLINLATAALSYGAFQRLSGRKMAGLLMSLFYTLFLYRLVIIHTRGAVGEALAMMFFPCVMLGVVQVLREGRFSAWLVVGLTGIIQSHIISLMITALCVAGYTVLCIFLRKTTWQNVLRFVELLALTVLINLWFLLPFIILSRQDLFIYINTRQIHEHGVYLPQMFASFVDAHGWSVKLGTTAGEMPLSVGLLSAAGIFVCLFGLYHPKEEGMEIRRMHSISRTSLVFAGFLLFISSVYFPWLYVAELPIIGDILYSIQFTWRFLGAASVFLAAMLGLGAYTLFRNRIYGKWLILLCLMLAILNVAPYIDSAVQSKNQSIAVADKFDNYVETMKYDGYYFYTNTDINAYRQRPSVLKTDEPIAFSNFTKQGVSIDFSYVRDGDVSAPVMVELPLYGFPLYSALWNGTDKLTLEQGENYILSVILPANEQSGTVSVRLQKPWYVWAGEGSTLFTLLALSGFWIWKKKWVVS
jgi:hypothetical protein